MKTAEYWKKRFEQLEDAQNQMGAAAAADIQKAYDMAIREISEKILLWYQRFADNNGITLAEARQWLKGKDLEELKWDVQEYIRHGEENAIDQQWMKELENASAKYHISKYEALEIKLRESIEELAGKYQMTMEETMGEIYQSGYYHTAFEIQKGIGIGYDIASVDQNAVEKVLSKPWAADGLNFSERIWNNKQKLIDVAHKELTQGIMLGKDPQKTIDAIAKQMNVSKVQAGRLVMTEEAYFASESRRDCFNELGVEQYVIVATLDNRTSEICQEMDGKIFKMSEYQVGVTAPPFHVNCRTTTSPYFEDMQDIVERAARDDTTGKVYDVPGDMKYKEWEDKFVQPKTLNQHKGDKVQITQQAIDKVRVEKISGYSEAELKELQTMNKSILTTAMKENNSNEVAMLWSAGKGFSSPALGDRTEVNFMQNVEMASMLRRSPARSLAMSHNHPSTSYFSCDDISVFIRYPSIKTMEIVTNKGKTWHITKKDNYDDAKVVELYQRIISENIGEELDKIVELFMQSTYNCIERNR